jgi:RHS repeat-associated protein
MGVTSAYQSNFVMPWAQNGAAPYSETHTNTWPDGLQATSSKSLQKGQLSDGFSLPDGTVFSESLGPDPVWGIAVPIAKTVALSEGNLKLSASASRSRVLRAKGDPFSVMTETDKKSINGRAYAATYTDHLWENVSPVGRTVTLRLDALERLASARVAGLNPTDFTYDARGRLAAAQRGTRETTFRYRGDGFLESVTDPLKLATGFDYDGDGRLVGTKRPDGGTIAYTYAANGNVTSVTPPGRLAHKFTYTPVNLPASYTPPAVPGTGPTIYAYDLDRNLAKITRPDGKTIDYGYDGAGRLVSIATANEKTVLTYRAATGNLASAANGAEAIAYAYNGPLPTTSTWSGPVSGSVGRTWNANFWVASENVGGGHNVAFSYDDDGLVSNAGSLAISRSGENGLVTGTKLGITADSRTYDGYGELLGYTASASGEALYSVTYTRDADGRIAAATEKVSGAANTYRYAYDRAGRLVRAEKNGSTDSYTYDPNSNRLSETVAGHTADGRYDRQDRLLRYGNASYNYTANGELASQTVEGKTTTYTYDALGNLIAAKLPNGTKIAYLVDAENHRVGKAVNGVLQTGFLYDGDAVVAQLDGKNRLVSQFVYATRSTTPDFMISGSVIYRIFSDQLGSPVLVVNASTGAVAEQIAYDEFGNVIKDTNPSLQPFRFASGLYDPDTGMVRFGARDYDPKIGRWTTKDPILFGGHEVNLYNYAAGDPVNKVDPAGLQAEDCVCRPPMPGKDYTPGPASTPTPARAIPFGNYTPGPEELAQIVHAALESAVRSSPQITDAQRYQTEHPIGTISRSFRDYAVPPRRVQTPRECWQWFNDLGKIRTQSKSRAGLGPPEYELGEAPVEEPTPDIVEFVDPIAR